MSKEPEIIVTKDTLTVHSGGERVTVNARDIDAITARVFAPSGIFQPALRWVSQGGHAAIMERPPFIARMAYRPGEAAQIDAEMAQHYNVPVPWQVYGAVFNADFTEVEQLYVFVRNSPLLDAEATLHMFPYPNVFNTSLACMGPAFGKAFAAANTDNLASAIAGVLGTFWSADFNEDAGPNTWYADWRAPTHSLPGAWVETLQSGNVTPWKLLRYYSEVPLENFVRFHFPVGNTLSPRGDTIAGLIDILNAAETVDVRTCTGLYGALRTVHAKAVGNHLHGS